VHDRKYAIKGANEMSTWMPSNDHAQFDLFCEPVEEFEHLPAIKAEPPKYESELPAEDEDASLDGLILAGLVAPY
jgi:hypothetical protein